MIGNPSQDANNRGLRLYGQNDRASSTSSGPKWTSSITDLLGRGVSNSNQMRYKNNQGPSISQSHQTSQHQLLQHQHQQVPSSSAQHLNNLSGTQPPNEGSRLMMKLMNGVVGANTQQLTTHHQPSMSSMSGMGAGHGSSSTFDHPRLSGSRDDQKRLALDECTNYLQQKTMQQHFPSTSMAISNIINSNRSGSSAGLQAQQQQTSNVSSTSAAAKKFQAFKFNLTLNKNKALGAQKDPQSQGGGLQPQPQQYSSNAFYQAQQMAGADQELEDNDAIVISEKNKKQIQALSRGSSQLAMKQHLKQMIKSYEDQPQLGGTNANGTQRFDYHQTQQMPQTDQQLTYDNALRGNNVPSGQTLQQPTSNVRMAPGSASSSSKGKPIEKKVHELEERQKIFEEEIIKRVKEIQTYAKTLHMHLKKLQQNQNKKTEDQQMLKDEVSQQIKDISDMIMATQNQRVSQHSNEISEQAVNDMVEKRLKILDSEVALQIEHLEQKLVKDYDSKIARQTRNYQSEIQNLREDITQDIIEKLKNDIMRQVTDKIQKFTEKSQVDLRAQLSETKSMIESSFLSDQQTFQRDINMRQDKLQKQIKDTQTNSDETIAAMSEAIRNEMEGIKKKLQGEIKLEVAKTITSQRELKDQLDEFQTRIDTIETQIQGIDKQPSQSQNGGNHDIDIKLQELQESLEDQISQVANQFNDHVQLQATKNDQIKSIQEAYLQLKQHQAASVLTLTDKQTLIENKLSQFGHEIEDIKQDLQEVRQTVQSQDETKLDVDNITDQVLEQIRPDIESLNDVTAQTSQQIEALKSKISSKIERSELQEVKQEIDSSIDNLQKSLTLKLSEVTAQVQDLHVDHDALVESITKMNQEASEKQTSHKQTQDQKIAQISADIQSKTDDLYDQLKEIEDRLNQTPQQQQVTISNQESTPERKSRVEALAALRASLEVQIGEINERLEIMVQSRSFDKNEAKSAIEELCAQQQDLEKQILSKIDTITDDKLDSYNSKINELDARVGTLEEKNFEEPAPKGGITEEQLEQRAESLSQEFQSSIDIVQNQVTQIEGLLEQQEQQNKEELENLKSDIRGIQELHNCLQDVMVTQEEFAQFKNLNSAAAFQIQEQPSSSSSKQIDELIAQLEEVKAENIRLAEMIELKADQEQMESASAKIDQHEERIKSLETRKNALENQEVNFLSSPRQIENQRAQGTEHNYQGHFLEGLSEAISSPNHQTNRTGTENDMLLFNNQTQSVGRNSMISNRLGNLVSPIVDRNFQFNSVASGIAPRVLLETTPIAPDQADPSSANEDSQDEQQHRSHVSENIEENKSQESYEHMPKSKDDKSSNKNEDGDDEDSNHPSQGGDGCGVQEINVSLESPRDEEKSADRKTAADMINKQRSISSQKGSSKLQGSSGKRQQASPFEENVEESKKEEGLSENEVSEEEFDNEFERGESVKEESQESEKASQDDNEEEKSEASVLYPNIEDSNIQLMSPQIQNLTVPVTAHAHPPGAPHQANHFVAFESDEEDVQQYDLLPISTQPNSRNNQGPHATSQSAVQQSAPHNNIAGRNRYFESGSGDEELAQSQTQSNGQVEENNQLDNFYVQFQERNNDEVDLQPEDQDEGSQERDPNEEEKDAEFDDSPFDAGSGQRFDQRFEDETDVRRPITSIGRNIRDQVEQNNREDGDPEIQHIHHETLSSHRTSEMSENNQPDVDISRRSGSPNLDHNNDNILGEDIDEDNQHVASSPSQQDFEESKIDPVAQSVTSLQLDHDLLPDQSKEQNPQKQDLYDGKDAVSDDQEQEEENDDWNLEDVTEPKVQQDASSVEEDQQESDKQGEEDDDSRQGSRSRLDEQPGHHEEVEEETKESENEIKSQMVANWIIENEIAKCIAAALSLRSRTLQQDDDQLQSEVEQQAEW